MLSSHIGGIAWLNFWSPFVTVIFKVLRIALNNNDDVLLVVDKDQYSMNSKIKNKVDLDSKLILILTFQKINLNYS